MSKNYMHRYLNRGTDTYTSVVTTHSGQGIFHRYANVHKKINTAITGVSRTVKIHVKSIESIAMK